MAWLQQKASRFPPVALAAIFFLSDPQSDIRRPMHRMDVHDVHVAEDGGLMEPPDRKYDLGRILADALAPTPPESALNPGT